MGLSPLYITSARGQCAALLLSALHDLYVKDARSSVTKREATSYIARNHWFAFHEEDQEPYPSQQFLSHEPRWQTMIAWARKDTVIRDYVSNEARDAWGITRLGRGRIEHLQAKGREGQIPVGQCYLWSDVFKRFMQPGYEPGATDAKRPANFYRDIWVKMIVDVDV